MSRQARPWPLWACAIGLACWLALPAGLGASAPNSGGAETTPAALRAGIQTLVGAAACSSDADCRSSAIGAKACGGPEAYIAWSVRSTDEAALNSALARYGAAQQAAITREGRVSNCAFVTDPGATCSAAGSCQLRQRSGHSGGASSR